MAAGGYAEAFSACSALSCRASMRALAEPYGEFVQLIDADEGGGLGLGQLGLLDEVVDEAPLGLAGARSLVVERLQFVDDLAGPVRGPHRLDLALRQVLGQLLVGELQVVEEALDVGPLLVRGRRPDAGLAQARLEPSGLFVAEFLQGRELG
jgi:hypothetical protein